MQIGRGAGLAMAGLVAAGAVAAFAMTRGRGEDVREPQDEPSAPPAATPPTSASPPTGTPPVSTPPTSTPTPITPEPAPEPPAATPPAATPPVVEAPAVETPVVDMEPVALRTYTVQSGDTLSAIARRFGTTVAAIAELNGIADPNRIRVGQRLQIPGRGSAPAPPPPAPAPTPAPAPAPPASGGGAGRVPPGPAISRVEGAGKRVALTFDDGPNGATTDAIVATLNRRGVDATFFVVGSNAARDGARLARMHRDGHVIANHSWNHPQLTTLGAAQVRSQLADTNAAIRRAVGVTPDIFRPPYGARNAQVDAIARELGLRDVIWDVDTRDWARPGSDAIVRSAVNDARNGSIVLLHDGGGNREQTAAAVDRIVTGLQARGFELVTVPELVAAGRS